MGPYCKFCDQRCFQHMPLETPQEALDAYGTSTIIATCRPGQEFELATTGWNADRIAVEIAKTGATTVAKATGD